MAARIRKGDLVVVISGKDKGKTGKVTRVLREDDRVVVQGINLVKRHTRPTPRTKARASFGITLITSPERPLSRPVRTTTLSPFLIFAAITAPPGRAR